MYAARVEPGEPPIDTERRERTIVPLKRIDGLRRLLERNVKKHITFGAGRNLRGMIGYNRIGGCETGNWSGDSPGGDDGTDWQTQGKM
jgi:hypothetical protein